DEGFSLRGRTHYALFCGEDHPKPDNQEDDTPCNRHRFPLQMKKIEQGLSEEQKAQEDDECCQKLSNDDPPAARLIYALQQAEKQWNVSQRIHDEDEDDRRGPDGFAEFEHESESGDAG